MNDMLLTVEKNEGEVETSKGRSRASFAANTCQIWENGLEKGDGMNKQERKEVYDGRSYGAPNR